MMAIAPSMRVVEAGRVEGRSRSSGHSEASYADDPRYQLASFPRSQPAAWITWHDLESSS